MPFTEIIAPDELTETTKFRLRINNWKKYNPGPTHQFVKLMPAKPSDTLRYDSLITIGLFCQLLRHAAEGVSRRPGWLVDGEDQPLTLPNLRDLLRLRPEENQQYFTDAVKSLMRSERISLIRSGIRADSDVLKNLEKPSETLKNLPEPTILDKNREDKNREDKNTLVASPKDATPEKVKKPFPDEVYRISERLWNTLVEYNKGRNLNCLREKNRAKWLKETLVNIDRLHRIDGQKYEDMDYVLDYWGRETITDRWQGWSSVCQTGASFRRAFDKMMAKLEPGTDYGESTPSVLPPVESPPLKPEPPVERQPQVAEVPKTPFEPTEKDWDHVERMTNEINKLQIGRPELDKPE